MKIEMQDYPTVTVPVRPRGDMDPALWVLTALRAVLDTAPAREVLLQQWQRVFRMYVVGFGSPPVRQDDLIDYALDVETVVSNHVHYGDEWKKLVEMMGTYAHTRVKVRIVVLGGALPDAALFPGIVLEWRSMTETTP